MKLDLFLLLVIRGHECIRTIFMGTSRKSRSAPRDIIPFLHWTMPASFGRSSISQASLWLKKASSSFGGEQSPVWPLLFRGLPLTLSEKSKSLQPLAGFYMFHGCCLHLLSIERAVHRRNQLTLTKKEKFKVQCGAQRSITDSKSLVCGKASARKFNI